LIKVLGICGSPVKDGNTMAFIQEVINSIQSNDVEAKIISAADLTISDCKHCNFCHTQTNQEKTSAALRTIWKLFTLRS